MGHINMPYLNLGTCSVICVWMCLNLGISSILKQNNANLQAFIDKSSDDVLPNKFRQRAKYLQNFYLTFCTDFALNIKNCAKENGTVQNIILHVSNSVHTFSRFRLERLCRMAVESSRRHSDCRTELL